VSSLREPGRAFLFKLLALAALGLVVRLVYGFSLDDPSGDAAFYHLVANKLADGDGFENPFLPVPTAAHPPLFPHLLAIVSLLGGTGIDAHQAAGCALGAATAVPIGYAGRRIAGPATGLAAAALAAVYLPMVANDSLMMSESAYGLTVALSVLALLRLADDPSPGRAFVAGLAIGAATLARAEALLLLVLVVAPLAWRAPARVKVGGLALLGAALVVLPWTARNLSAFDRVVLVSTNDGSVLSGANCDATYGPNLGGWDLGCSIRAGAAGGSVKAEQQALEEALQHGQVSKATTAMLLRAGGRNEAVVAARQRRKGIDYALDNLGDVPKVVAARVGRTWSLYRVREQVRINGFFRGSPAWLEWLTVASFALVFLLAVAGAAALREQRRRLLVLLAPVLLVTLVSAAGFGTPRFRQAAEVVLVLLAAVALTRVLGGRASRAVSGARPVG
jgi:4-amino-4-deoxy-L-arabinose transferase-like glycosyltransferase